ncbi:dihydrofolate reductase, partial [Streptomyces zhihengii]
CARRPKRRPASASGAASPGGVLVGSSGEAAELEAEIASHVFVAKR